MSAAFKAGDKLRVKVGQGDAATQSGNLLEDGDIVTVHQDYVESRATLGFTRADGTYGTAFPHRFELVLPEVKAEVSIKSGTQLAKVLALTLGQGSWTLSGIAAATGASEASASARLRDIRAAGYTVTCSKPKGETQRRYEVRMAPICLPA